ncbi:hypothetical protein CMUST_11050 [Corynebacterium mustelae]|uniref:Uncharacterized protein n=2 Tax=Corynebacterium mustelae TaxID=571915 RepID=A0A0G3H164_9CORY|nr:hypothetical protein CMUST_11050 [Corynebacterium mustelae]
MARRDLTSGTTIFRTQRMNKLNLAIGFLVVGIVSLVLSMIAAGIDYRLMEHEYLVCSTPQWVLIWNVVSLISVVAAASTTIAVLLHGRLKRRKAQR